jgi:hypothetical protein
MAKEYVIYCDESVHDGKYCSDFYGGLLITSGKLTKVIARLEKEKHRLGLGAEIKWGKVTHQYLTKYIAMMDIFFKEIHHGNIKVRIMFRQTAHKATGLTHEQKEGSYFLLYYQFLKHAFGLRYCNEGTKKHPIQLKFFFDELPDKSFKNEIFKNHIYSLQSLNIFSNQHLEIKRENIAEVDSSKHVLMQCLDIVLGAMAFRLNNKHKEKPPDAKRRAKRTIAKEKLYKHILKKIRKEKAHFNPGISTGREQLEDLWKMPYRHWNFLPANFEIDETLYK